MIIIVSIILLILILFLVFYSGEIAAASEPATALTRKYRSIDKLVGPMKIDEVYVPDNQLQTIISEGSDIDYFNLMRMLSDFSISIDEKDISQVRKQRDYTSDVDRLCWLTGELFGDRKYGKILVLSSNEDVRDIVKSRFSDSETISLDDKPVAVDLIFLHECESVDVYSDVKKYSGPDTIVISKYYIMFDDFDRMLFDIYNMIQGHDIVDIMTPIDMEKMRDENIKMYCAYNEYSGCPYHVWYCGTFTPQKINRERISCNMDTDEHTILSDIFGRDIGSMDRGTNAEFAKKQIDRCYSLACETSKTLSTYLYAISEPQIILDNEIIVCYMMFDDNFVDYLKNNTSPSSQYVVYVVDYMGDNAELYYSLCGYKYNRATDIIDGGKKIGLYYSNEYKIRDYYVKVEAYNSLSITTFFFSQNEDIQGRFRDVGTLFNVYNEDREIFDNAFLKYIGYAGQLTPENIENIKELSSSPYTADKVLDYVATNVPKTKTLEYSGKGKKISGAIKSVIAEYGDRNVKLRSFLDIGGVDDSVLRAISKYMRIPFSACWGVNIDEETEGYLNYNYNISKEHIMTYDGINIPELGGTKKYDIMSIIHVLHHIPEPVLEKLVHSIYARCGRYLIIRDNDLTTDNTITYFMWQHYIYDRTLALSGYIRTDLTLKKVIDMFENAGFKYKGGNTSDAFVRGYTVLFEKK